MAQPTRLTDLGISRLKPAAKGARYERFDLNEPGLAVREFAVV